MWFYSSLPILLNLESWVIFVLNSLCLASLFRGKLFATKENPIYLIIGYNLLFDSGVIFVHAVFVGPSFFFGDWLLDEEFTSFLFVFFWYSCSFIQILLALNRLAVILVPRRRMFNHYRIGYALVFLTVSSFFLTILTQNIFECCRIAHDRLQYGYVYVPSNATNFSLLFVNLPLNISTSILCLTSYITLFFYVFQKKSTLINSKMSHEIRLCIQCALMFLIFNFTWITFTILPKNASELRIILTIAAMISFGGNSMVYLVLNNEVQNQLRILGISKRFYKTINQKQMLRSQFTIVRTTNLNYLRFFELVLMPISFDILFLKFTRLSYENTRKYKESEVSSYLMATYVLEVVLPLLVNVAAWIFLFTNIICFSCLVRGRLQATEENLIYLIIGYNLFSDTGATLVHALFVEPTIYLGEWFMKESTYSFVAVFFWYTGLSTQVFLALHRVFAVVFPHAITFTHRFVCIGLIILTVYSFILTLLSQSIISCCRVKYYPIMLGFSYEKHNATNYSQLYVDYPANGSLSIICVISYTTLLGYVFKIRSSTRNSNLLKEIRLGLQCALMFFISTFTWMCFSFVAELNYLSRSLVTMLGLLHFCTNAIVYIIFNRDVKNQLNEMRISIRDLFSTTSNK